MPGLDLTRAAATDREKPPVFGIMQVSKKLFDAVNKQVKASAAVNEGKPLQRAGVGRLKDEGGSCGP